MFRYIIVRILLMIPTVFGEGALVFFLMRIILGDICLTRWVDFGTDLNPGTLNLCRQQLGLDRPILSQLWEFFRKTFTLDFGVSMWTGNNMREEIKLRLALSFQLAFMALSLKILTAIPLGVVAAFYKGRWLDYIIQVFFHYWCCHSLLLVRHHGFSGHFDHYPETYWQPMYAAHHFCVTF